MHKLRLLLLLIATAGIGTHLLIPASLSANLLPLIYGCAAVETGLTIIAAIVMVSYLGFLLFDSSLASLLEDDELREAIANSVGGPLLILSLLMSLELAIAQTGIWGMFVAPCLLADQVATIAVLRIYEAKNDDCSP